MKLKAIFEKLNITVDRSNQKSNKLKNVGNTENNTQISSDIIINNFYSSIQEKQEKVREVEVDENKITNIKQIKDIYKLARFAELSNDEVFEIIINNNLFQELINSKNIRHADVIKKNLLFLEKSTNEEKNTLIWLYLFKALATPVGLNLLEKESTKTYIDSIRKKFPFPNKLIDSDFIQFLNSMGVMHQFIATKTVQVTTISLKIPEAKIALNFNHINLIDYSHVLELSVEWLLKKENIGTPSNFISNTISNTMSNSLSKALRQ